MSGPSRTREVDVAVVGGGLSGSTIASILAQRGHDVVVLERTPAYRWRACGVFASPAALDELRAVGLDEGTLAVVARPIGAMRVEAPGGTSFRLTYGHDDDRNRWAVGFDRSQLDPALLDLARAHGAEVRIGETVIELQRAGREVPGMAAGWTVTSSGSQRDNASIRARVVVGADGIRSTVARAVGVKRRVALAARIGLTYHLSENSEGERPCDARMVVLRGGYCGVAPVPGGRVNVGIVLGGREWRARLRRVGARAVCSDVVTGLPVRAGDDDHWRWGDPLDQPMGAVPLSHAVSRRAGPGWILIGDAAGFLDPFTGEGIHRAIVSARLGAEAVDAQLCGRTGALEAYGRAMERRFGSKDLVSWLVQAFLAAPPLFNYAARRLASRSAVRNTMGLVMGDLVPASRALDPRFLAALLSP